MQAILDKHKHKDGEDKMDTLDVSDLDTKSTNVKGTLADAIDKSETDGGPMAALSAGVQSGTTLTLQQDDCEMRSDTEDALETGTDRTAFTTLRPSAADRTLIEDSATTNSSNIPMDTEPCYSESDSFASEAILHDSRPQSTASQASSAVSSLQAFSSGSSGENSLVFTDNEDSGEVGVSAPLSGSLLSPPRIVITDFSVDEPTDVDPFEGVKQTSLVCM